MSVPFGICLTIVAYTIGVRIKQKYKYDFLNPLLIAVIIIVSTMLLLGKPYESYKAGGDYIHFFLSPLTVVLGVTLYRQRTIIKQNFIPMLVGILSGIITSLLCIVFIGKLLGLDVYHIITLVPKSITSPMAISLNAIISGDTSLLVVMIQFTGVVGAIFSPYLVKLFKRLDKVAIGVGIGTASHAIGTSKALEIGDVEGAASSTAMGLTGLLTVLVIPFILEFFV